MCSEATRLLRVQRRRKPRGIRPARRWQRHGHGEDGTSVSGSVRSGWVSLVVDLLKASALGQPVFCRGDVVVGPENLFRGD